MSSTIDERARLHYREARPMTDPSGPTLADCWRMALRDGPHVLDLDKAVADMAWLVASGTAPPYELAGPHDSDGGNRPTTYRNCRLEDGNGNELQLEHVAAVLNHVPALLQRIRTLEARLSPYVLEPKK